MEGPCEPSPTTHRCVLPESGGEPRVSGIGLTEAMAERPLWVESGTAFRGTKGQWAASTLSLLSPACSVTEDGHECDQHKTTDLLKTLGGIFTILFVT